MAGFRAPGHKTLARRMYSNREFLKDGTKAIQPVCSLAWNPAGVALGRARRGDAFICLGEPLTRRKRDGSARIEALNTRRRAKIPGPASRLCLVTKRPWGKEQNLGNNLIFCVLWPDLERRVTKPWRGVEFTL